jgi:hypothetical protein
MPEKRSWVIDVCRTCDRLAVWPFCEHRPTSPQYDRTDSWCVPVVVYTTAKREAVNA